MDMICWQLGLANPLSGSITCFLSQVVSLPESMDFTLFRVGHFCGKPTGSSFFSRAIHSSEFDDPSRTFFDSVGAALFFLFA